MVLNGLQNSARTGRGPIGCAAGMHKAHVANAACPAALTAQRWVVSCGRSDAAVGAAAPHGQGRAGAHLDHHAVLLLGVWHLLGREGEGKLVTYSWRTAGGAMYHVDWRFHGIYS